MICNIKKLALLIITLSTVFFSNAQDPKKVRVGLAGSGIASWLKPNIDGGYGYERKGINLGYTGGIALDFRLFDSDNYAFATGINLMQIGGKINHPDISVANDSVLSSQNWITTATYNLRYIDIPLTIKMKTNEIGYLTYYGQVGLGLGVPIKATRNMIQTNELGLEVKPEEKNKIKMY